MKSKVILFAVFFLVLNASLFSQLGMGNGRIKGEIRNETGDPVEGVKVTVLNLTYSTMFTSVSNKSGRWSVAGLAAGPYRIAVTKEGYHEAKIDFTLSLVSLLVHKLDIMMKSEKSGPPERPQEGTPDPKSAALAKLLQQGNALYEEQKFCEARTVFEDFLLKNPKIYQVQINIGNCCLQMKQYDLAIAAYLEYLDKAMAEKGDLQGDAEAAGVMSAIGKAFLDQNNVEKAKEYFKKAIDVLPQDEILAFIY